MVFADYLWLLKSCQGLVTPLLLTVIFIRVLWHSEQMSRLKQGLWKPSDTLCVYTWSPVSPPFCLWMHALSCIILCRFIFLLMRHVWMVVGFWVWYRVCVLCVCSCDTNRITCLKTGQTGPALGFLGHCAAQHSLLALMVCWNFGAAFVVMHNR